MLVNMSGGKKVTVVEDVEPVLLWTNASPNSEFAAQTVAINLSDYGGILLETGSLQGGINVDKAFCYVRKASDYQALGSVRAGHDGSWGYVRGMSYGSRDVTVTDSGLTFKAGYSDNGNLSNARVIPTRIWGVNFTL